MVSHNSGTSSNNDSIADSRLNGIILNFHTYGFPMSLVTLQVTCYNERKEG